MPRVSNNVARLKRKRRILKHAKGYFGRRKNLYKTAKEAVERGWRYAYRNAAARLHDLSYSRFMNGLKLAGIDINRKILADIAIRDPNAFARLAEAAKARLN